jgi:hypothetical protein
MTDDKKCGVYRQVCILATCCWYTNVTETELQHITRGLLTVLQYEFMGCGTSDRAAW